MAKRFTDTDKWKKPFIRSMKAPYKLLWLYILDECDHAGIWHVDFEVAEIRTGEKIKKELALDSFKDKIIVFDNGHKWFIPYFIQFQYGELKIENRAHNSVIQLLSKYNLMSGNKPLTSPLQGAMDMDKDKEMDKDKDKDKDKCEKEIEIQQIETDFGADFMLHWGKWKIYKKTQFKFEYKTIQTEQTSFNELNKLANSNEQTAIEIIQQSIANGWKGFFELKKDNYGKTSNPTFGNSKNSIAGKSTITNEGGFGKLITH